MILSSGYVAATMAPAPHLPMPVVTLRAENFRVLRRLEWSPDGVCLLAGPNGSGKTTVLDALSFLRGLFLYGHESALGWVGGSYFRRLGTPEEEPVTFEIEVNDILWRLRFPMSMTGLRGQYGEELFRAGELVLRAAMFDEGWYLGDQRLDIDRRRCCAKVLLDMGGADWMKPLERALSDMRTHSSYDLPAVRKHEAATGVESYLHKTGRNLWSVLSNWSQAPIIHRGKFQWVLREAQRAFPDVMSTIEFDRGLPFLFGPEASEAADGLPPGRAADGLMQDRALAPHRPRRCAGRSHPRLR